MILMKCYVVRTIWKYNWSRLIYLIERCSSLVIDDVFIVNDRLIPNIILNHLILTKIKFSLSSDWIE
jgi:hypothetical protein